MENVASTSDFFSFLLMFLQVKVKKKKKCKTQIWPENKTQVDQIPKIGLQLFY